MSSRPQPTRQQSDPGRSCHAAAVAVAGDPDEVAARFAAALARRGLDVARLWVDRVPASAAAARRAAELARPLPADGPPVRAVLLRHDAGADLVLVARRGPLTGRALGELAVETAGTAPPAGAEPTAGPGPGDRTEDVEPEPAGQPGPAGQAESPGSAAGETAGTGAEDDGKHEGDTAWRGGNPRADRTASYAFAVPAGTDLLALTGAVGAVLARFGGVRRVRVGTLRDEGPAVVPVSVDGTLRALAARPAEPAPWPAPGRTPDAGPPEAVVGVLTADSPADTYLPSLTPPWPLTLTLRGSTVTCDFRTGVWSAEVVATVAGYVTRVLGQLLADGDRALADCDLFDDAERDRVAALGGAAVDLPELTGGIHERVAGWARATPDAPAVSYGDDRLTYAQLDARAGRIAAALRARGCGPGTRVGVCLERSVDLVAALLGVLRAGAAYVPIDPTYPAERIRYTVEDSRVSLLVGADGVEVDELLADDTDDATGGGAATAGPDDPAYVIYTSGSTGRPKGVQVPHRNVLALVAATRDEFGLGPADTWTMFHSSAFDFSVWEIWGCLLTGGHLVVVPHLVVRDPAEFHALLRAERVTVLNQTPSAFAQLVDADRRAADRLGLRLVVFGGEPLDAGMLTGWFDRYPERDCRMVNMFGITETTVHVTAQTIDRGLALAGTRSVGRPLPGWYVHVLDPAGRLLPPGAAGEIHVGGAGVADGYLHRDELTAQRFLPDPWRGGRMYRSGDRGRLLPDGRLEHLGRLDDQVKIRGYRIELDEIRQVLLDDPDVLAVAVTVDTVDARLHAYVVLADGADPPAELRRRVARILPEYMVPATVTPLPALPLTANGKLDAARLPAPAARPLPAAREAADPGAGPGRAERIRVVWERVLGAEVGPEDNFFDLGGNSLLALRLLRELRAQGLGEFTPRHLYVHPTVRALVGATGTER
ncbi:amino acid adenylation domain-containing protein [Micromonospora sp. DSM 115977]|uniref:Amino acid adenylation domain-containing protein n=1 Tax=Micromonospora reichwaldensis TaxID=3075516 RepID=A0ABU2WS21_9ACTN|nr:amino acid adenylation domain-containing protein [Micromonospora sp. DSM 115977]MDT0528064.1 amino acid adenylation domain-containing protein [Micromonospora sp. DSM 115977]